MNDDEELKHISFAQSSVFLVKELLAQGKAGTPVILLIFLIWANVGGEVKQ